MECLSDEQIVPILFALDADTLLSCGRANRRLNRLVCDQQVWKHLLKGIDCFGEVWKSSDGEMVYVYEEDDSPENDHNKRMAKLVKFVVDMGSSKMKAVLVKEVATRFKISAHDEQWYISTKKGSNREETCLSKITTSIQGWDDVPDTFEMSEYHLHQLNNLAQIVGATVGTIIIKEVKSFEYLGPRGLNENFTLIAALVGQQEEVLDKLEVQTLSAAGVQNTMRDIFFSLARASKEWKVREVHFHPRMQNGENIWPENLDLAAFAGSGHIGTVRFWFPILNGTMKRAKKEDVKALWEIAEKFRFKDLGIVSGGGRAREEDSKTSWEEAYENQLHNIC